VSFLFEVAFHAAAEGRIELRQIADLHRVT
jgi:hypothetical protein